MDIEFTNQGIRSGKDFISWPEISEIYFSWVRETTNFFFASGETQSIVIDSTTGKRIIIELEVPTRMDSAISGAFNRLREIILDITAERHWEEFMDRLTRGELISFGPCAIRMDGVFFKDYLRKWKEPLAFPQITGFNIHKAIIQLFYVDPQGREKKSKLGMVYEIPNIHVLTAFLGCIVEANSKELGAPVP